MEGYWEWVRKDGTKMRSGHFNAGQQVGEWITYDQQGHVYKVTNMDRKNKIGCLAAAIAFLAYYPGPSGA
jgi:antitoxin component YwqK of YwqJK toxin-antitoxin module